MSVYLHSSSSLSSCHVLFSAVLGDFHTPRRWRPFIIDNELVDTTSRIVYLPGCGHFLSSSVDAAINEPTKVKEKELKKCVKNKRSFLEGLARKLTNELEWKFNWIKGNKRRWGIERRINAKLYDLPVFFVSKVKQSKTEWEALVGHSSSSERYDRNYALRYFPRRNFFSLKALALCSFINQKLLNGESFTNPDKFTPFVSFFSTFYNRLLTYQRCVRHIRGIRLQTGVWHNCFFTYNNKSQYFH